MAGSPSSFDPTAAWAEFVQRWEREINDWSGKLTETEQFGSMMGQATKIQILAQKSFNDHMEKTLKALNLPTREQVEALGSRLAGIEAQIEALRLAMQPSGAPAEDRPQPKRTRKPPA